MREIKFRVWDGEKVVYLSPLEVENENRGMICAGEVDRNPIAVMQYTGLKDKNGKEIYEGDLLLVEGWKGTQQIVWHKWGAWHLNGGAYELGFFNPHICMEVIGNIYENPELLPQP